MPCTMVYSNINEVLFDIAIAMSKLNLKFIEMENKYCSVEQIIVNL